MRGSTESVSLAGLKRLEKRENAQKEAERCCVVDDFEESIGTEV